MISAMTKMMISSGIPIEPNIVVLLAPAGRASPGHGGGGDSGQAAPRAPPVSSAAC